MTRIRTFQLLVIASVVLHYAWVFLPDEIMNPSPEASEMLRWSGYEGTSLLQHPVFHISIAAASGLAALGLCFLRPWGRWLLVAELAVSLAQLPFNGIAVALPIDRLVGALDGLVQGTVLGLAFLSPIADSFTRTASQEPESDEPTRCT